MSRSVFSKVWSIDIYIRIQNPTQYSSNAVVSTVQTNQQQMEIFSLDMTRGLKRNMGNFVTIWIPCNLMVCL